MTVNVVKLYRFCLVMFTLLFITFEVLSRYSKTSILSFQSCVLGIIIKISPMINSKTDINFIRATIIWWWVFSITQKINTICQHGHLSHKSIKGTLQKNFTRHMFKGNACHNRIWCRFCHYMENCGKWMFDVSISFGCGSVCLVSNSGNIVRSPRGNTSVTCGIKVKDDKGFTNNISCQLWHQGWYNHAYWIFSI